MSQISLPTGYRFLQHVFHIFGIFPSYKVLNFHCEQNVFSGPETTIVSTNICSHLAIGRWILLTQSNDFSAL